MCIRDRFSSDFDKANRELVSIKAVMTELEEMIENMPSLLEDAKEMCIRDRYY